MSILEQRRKALLALSHELGAEHRDLAILGEGNTSAGLGNGRFLVKASGSSLGTLGEGDLVECVAAPLLEVLRREEVSDGDVDAALAACKADPAAKRPSVEALFHAYFLSLPGVEFVGHTHPVAVNSILCSPRAADFAQRRCCPDEIVCCGPSSVLVPYTDPGVWLAQGIRARTEAYIHAYGTAPRVVLLENHGVITFGGSPESVKASMFMAVKAARVFAGAVALGGPVFLSEETVRRIGSRRDEHYRQAALKL
jgi:rhamnose utilization protein RhaD (predicted bifunctional aldolase and dehydrogenase)